MKKNTTSIWLMNDKGSLVFPATQRVTEMTHKSASVFEHSAVSFIVMFLCAALDFIMFKQLFGSFLYDSLIIQYMSIIGLLIGFDFVPIYLGMKIREKQQGYNVSSLLLGILAAAFIIAFLLNVILRLDMKDQVLPDLSGYVQMFSGTASDEIASSSHALIYAIFAACIPLVTSLGSFGISYATYNPLKNEVKKLQEIKNMLEADIIQTDSILAEYDADSMDIMSRDDMRRYLEVRQMITDMAVYYCNYTRERLKEHLGSPASTNELSRFEYEKLSSRLQRSAQILKDEGADRLPENI